MGIPVKTKLSFMGVEEALKHEVIDVALHMHKKDVTSNLETKGNTNRFSFKFLIEKSSTFINAQSWQACYVVISLAINGIVIFLNLEYFIDLTTIRIFLTKNLVSTLLDDMYYYLS